MNSITEGVAKERGDPVLDNAAAKDLKTEIAEASELLANGNKAEARERSSFQSRADLREAAVNETLKRDPNTKEVLMPIDAQLAQKWAALDVSDFNRLRSESKREVALDSIAANMRISADYADALKKTSPVIAESAERLNTERKTQEKEVLDQIAKDQFQSNVAADAARRTAMLEAEAMAHVAARRNSEVRQVADKLLTAPEKLQLDRDELNPEFKRSLSLEQTLNATTSSREDIAKEDTNSSKVVKRPVLPEEVDAKLQAKYIVSQEKRGVFDKGSTVFCHKTGEYQGRVAFEDCGKVLATQAQDKNTIRSMIELAESKGWKEITVNGTDEFRRLAWLEANLDGLKVNGYQPREADYILLNALKEREQATNTITLGDERTSASQEKESRTNEKSASSHFDLDVPSKDEKTVLDNSKAFLESRNLSDKFTDATINELNSLLRGQRAYVGTLTEHGLANYQFDKNNEMSYFAKLETESGEKIVWGKKLDTALSNVEVGQRIILKLTEKEKVEVKEKVFDKEGNYKGVEWKPAELNTWQAIPLERLMGQPHSLNKENRDKRPALPVYQQNQNRTQEKMRSTPEQEKEVGNRTTGRDR